MRTKLFIVSDLHLGGKPGEDGKPGFQITPEPNQRRLAHFIHNLPRPAEGQSVELVLAGDIVDFLAEEEFRAFTSDKAEALRKLQNIVARTKPFWDALKQFVSDCGLLTFMLGNHDIEMCLPAARQFLSETLGDGPVRFIYDNEAFTLGPVLIEHGNRYDEWNAVPHSALRRVRSRQSRGLPARHFPSVPGSQLVVEVMNKLKAEYSWVDLLKPENAGALPMLAAVGAGDLKDIWKVFGKYRSSKEVEYDDEREPEDETFIASEDESGSSEQSDRAMFHLAQDIAAGGDATQVGAFDFLKVARDAATDAVREARRKALHKALRAFADHHHRTFDTGVEDSIYLTPAQAAAKRGFKVVVYGHTHLVKKVLLESPDGEAVYLNTGTWADLMRMPDAIFGKDTDAARKSLDQFVADLERDEVAKWRRSVPTYALIELDGERVEKADVYFQDQNGSEPVTTEGFLQRLDAEEQDHA